METIEHSAPLWRWAAGNGVGWFFLTVDKEAAESLSATALMRRLERGTAKGFGALRVCARIGASQWQTSIFPAKDGSWWLPVKAAIRRTEEIGEGDFVAFSLDF